MIKSHLVFLVHLLHASLALGLCDDFSGVLNNNLMRLKSSHGAHTKATILGIQNLYTVVVAVTLCTLLQLCKRSIVALLFGKWAIRTIAFVSHDTVVAVVSTAVLDGAKAL